MDLLSQIKTLVTEERRITTDLLKLLARAERERLYAERGYSSMHDFCIKELGYSESAATRRINSMRLMQRHAEVEEKIQKGALTITIVNQMEGAFRRARTPINQQKELLRSVEGLSTREVEKKLFAILPEIEPPKRELRAISQTESLLKIVINEELLEKIEKLKALYSHIKPGMSYRDLVEMLVDKALKPKKHRDAGAGVAWRYIPPVLKTKIRGRDQSRCTYVDPQTGRRCESRHLLEFDHIIPVAHGGRATEQNLRLLCRTHNQLAAEKAGLAKPSRSSPNTS